MNQKINRSNILQHELIGLPVKIVRSSNNTQLGTEGEILDETMKMLIVHTKNRKLIIPKQGTTFRLKLFDGSTEDVEGDLILRRPEDRVKAIRRRAS